MDYSDISKEEVLEIKKEYYKDLNNFEKRLFDNMDVLIDRSNKLKILKRSTLDYFTYYDATLTQIRAMFIEAPKLKSNHTFQNYLYSIGQVDFAEKIDNYLSMDFIEKISLREAIKISVDKFIVHYDNVNEEETIIEHLCRTKLTEPDSDKNLCNIISDLMQLLIKGNLKAWERYYTNK